MSKRYTRTKLRVKWDEEILAGRTKMNYVNWLEDELNAEQLRCENFRLEIDQDNRLLYALSS